MMVLCTRPECQTTAGCKCAQLQAANQPKRRLAVGVLFNTVTVEIICPDDYEAQVLYDDLVERMQSGQGITISAR